MNHSTERAVAKGYAVAHLTRIDVGPEIVTYLEKIDATLAPFEGRFLVHGGPAHVLEGPWSGSLIVIEFPDLQRAQSWYASEAYQTILPLRTEHADGWALVVEGVTDGHVATDVLAPRR